ncbi:MAG: hypothetical protein U1E53_17085 [Dongiaceae bacterium]
MPTEIAFEPVQLGNCCLSVELPVGWPCGLRPSGSWWCQDPDGLYSLDIALEIRAEDAPAASRPLDRAQRRAAALRQELAGRHGRVEVIEEPTPSGVMLRADYRDGGARAASWRSLLGFDRSVAEARFTLRMAPERWADPIVPALVARLRAQALGADCMPPAGLASARDYRIDDACVITMPSSWHLQRQERAFLFHAAEEAARFTVAHHWDELRSPSPENPAELGLALAYDFQATLRRNGDDGDVEPAPLGGLVTTVRSEGGADPRDGGPPLTVTAWYYLIPVERRLLAMVFGLMAPGPLPGEPWIAALPGDFRRRIREVRLA